MQPFETPEQTSYSTLCDNPENLDLSYTCCESLKTCTVFPVVQYLIYTITLTFHDHVRCPGMELNISSQLSSPASLSIKMPPCYRGLPRRTPISNLHAHLQIIPILQFIYHLTDKFFVSCPAHPNPLIHKIGNYTLEDLHRQYTKYRHKRIKHILLSLINTYPDVAMFFSYCNDDFFTAFGINVVFNAINFNCLN